MSHNTNDDFRHLNVRFNRADYQILDKAITEAAIREDRSKVAVVRRALCQGLGLDDFQTSTKSVGGY